jgi:hypothetical protein
MIIEKIPIDNNAFIFGLDTFIALVFQTLLSILVTEVKYLNDIKRQFVVYAFFHGFIGLIFVGILVVNVFRKRE